MTITSTKKSISEFVTQVVSWVEEISSAFEKQSDAYSFTWTTLRSLKKMRELINEICLWANSRCVDGRWAQNKYRLMIVEEIDEFEARLGESKMLFQDLSLIHLTGRVGVMRTVTTSISLRQDAILKEIAKIKKQQKEQLILGDNDVEAQKQAKIRQELLAETLDRLVVSIPSTCEQRSQPCEEGTRVAELRDIETWLNVITPESQNFLLLTGAPGSGKSAISASLTEYCLQRPEHVLLTQFFINRNNKETTNPNSYFPTIARQLVEKCPEAEGALYDSLKEWSALAPCMTSKQAAKFFVGVLAATARPHKNKIVAVIIDSLDETDKTYLRDTAIIFSLLSKELSRYPNVKVFISSCNEINILNRLMEDTNVKRINLDTEDSAPDIALLLEKRMRKIADQYVQNWEVWPGEKRMAALVSQTSGRFIWAVKAIEFIEERIKEDGLECLDYVLEELTGVTTGDINALYARMLRWSQKEQSSSWDFGQFQRIIGAIAVWKESLCLDDLSFLLNLRRGPASGLVDIVAFVRRLRTIIVVGIDAISGKTVPRLHRSFIDFVTDAGLLDQHSLDSHFCIGLFEAEAMLGVCCLEQFALASRTSSPASLNYASKYYFSHAEAVVGSTPGLVLRDQRKIAEDLSSLLSVVRRSGFSSLRFSKDVEGSHVLLPLIVAYPVSETGSPISRVLKAARSRIYCLAYSPNGEQLVSGLYDGLIILWDVQAGRQIGHFEGHTSWVQTVSFSPSGDRIASGSRDETVRIWNLKTNQARSTILKGHSGSVRSVAFSPDQKCLASASVDKFVRLWDTFSGELIASLPHETSVSSVVFTPNGNQALLISGTSDGSVHIWDRTKMKCQQILKSFIYGVHSVAISPLGDLLAAIGDGGAVFWNNNTDGFTFDEELSFQLHHSPDSSHFRTAFAPDGNSIVLWHNSYSKPTFVLYLFNSRVRIPISSPPTVNAFALSPDGCSITFNDDEKINIWATVGITALSPDGDTLACTFSDGTIWLGNYKDLPVFSNRLEGELHNVTFITFSSNSSFLTAADNKYIYLWDVAKLKLRARGSLKNLPQMSSLTFFCDRQTVVSIHENESMRAWDVENGTLCYRAATPFPDLDSPLLLDVDEVDVHEVAGAKWFPAKKEGSGHWAYIDGNLIRARMDGTMTVLSTKTMS